MLNRLIKTAANEYLRHRRASTGKGPGRLPPTSANEVKSRAARGVVRWVMRRFTKR